MELAAVGIENGLPVAIYAGEDKNEMIVETLVGFHNENPVLLREYRRVFFIKGDPVLAFELNLN